MASTTTREPSGPIWTEAEWNEWLGPQIPNLTSEVTIDETSRPIGSGGSALIYRARRNGVDDVAVKRPVVVTEPILKAIRNELEASWVAAKHENVLKVFGVCIDRNIPYFVMEYMEDGNLLDYVKSHPDVDRVTLLTGTAAGLAHLHENRITHGDVKAVNILVGPRLEAKLCDFGLSKLGDDTTMSSLAGQGSRLWQAPELFKNARKSSTSDTYAYGITIAEVKMPGDDGTPHLLLVSKQVLKGGLKLRQETPGASPYVAAQNNGEERPNPDPGSSVSWGLYAPVWEVARRCWEDNPGKRITMSKAHKILKRHLTERIIPIASDGRAIANPPQIGDPKKGFLTTYAAGERSRAIEQTSYAL